MCVCVCIHLREKTDFIFSFNKLARYILLSFIKQKNKNVSFGQSGRFYYLKSDIGNSITSNLG